MLAHYSRAAWTALACILFAAHAQAQTSIEIYAGGTPFVGAAGNTVPMRPHALALSPDGKLLVGDEGGSKLLSYDPITSAVTSVPNLPGMLEFRFVAPQAMAGDPSGALNLMANSEQWQLDLVDGTKTYIGPYTGATWFSFGPDGSMYFSQSGDNAVHRRSPSGTLTIIAGSAAAGFSGDGTTVARLRTPRGVAVDAAGNIYIADSGNQRVRRRDAATGIFSTVAGTGSTFWNGDNALGTQLNLWTPDLLTFDAAGNLYISEADGHRIRKLNVATNRLVTIAGNGSTGGNPGNGGSALNASLARVVDIKVAGDGTLYMSEMDSYRVRKVDTGGIISQVMGNGTPSFCGDGVPARQACLNRPNGIAIHGSGDVYFSDQNNHRLRKISAATGIITTVAGGNELGPNGDGGPASAARFSNGPFGLAVDSGRNVYIATDGRVRRIDAATGIISAFAGTTTAGFSGDGGAAQGAQFNGVSRVALDAAGNLYISDIYNNRVRKVNALTGTITTVAGNGLDTGPLGDGGPATMASLAWPHNLAFDADGNLYIGDTNHYRIRKVNIATGVISTVAGNGNSDITGNGGPATAASIGSWPAIDVDSAGNIYVTSSEQLRRIDAQTGIIDQVPAPSWGLFTPEGRGLENPNDMVLGPDNRLYITDAATNNLVLRVSGLPIPGSDWTPPVIQPVISGTEGANGWYRSDVSVSWNVTDAESAVSATSGCEWSQVTADTDGVTFKCTATSTGGTASKSVTIKRDATPPTLTFGAISPAPAANGWNGGPVSIPFTTQDAMSGVFQSTSGSPLTFTQDGAGLTQQVNVMDFAGNAATFTSPAVNIDRTAPSVHYSISGTAGNAGWYRSDVVLTWIIDDTQSLLSSNGCESTTITQDTVGTAFTCTATSTGGTNTQTVIIKRDATPPTLTFGDALPAADANGWRGPVSVPFNASDATSGVASTSSLNPLAITATGAGVTGQVTVTDTAGNSATFTSPVYNIDASAPTVDYVVTGLAGINGWYRGDVHVSWQVNESESAVNREGCDDTTISSDTAGVTLTCMGSSAGGMTFKSVTIKRDATPPQLSFGAPSPLPNANGWFNSDVGFTFDTSDALSGVASISDASPVVVGGEGVNLGRQVVITDAAGNSASFTTPPVNIDRSPPSLQPAVVGVLGANGWYTSDVQVHWAINESPTSLLSTSGCDDSSVTADTSGVTFNCSVTSGGGSASSSVTIKRDATPPVLTFGSPTPVPNTNGWNKTNVSIPFTRGDALSGLASTSVTSPLVLSTEGAAVTGQVVVTDNAGNNATFTSVERNIDKTAPVVAFNSPADGATYGFYQNVAADYACTDVSLVSCTAPNPSGELINTRTAGARTFKVTAKDSVSFVTAETHAFTVESTFNFSGFSGPIAAPPVLNLVNRGALVPIRWQLPDGHGGFVTDPVSFTSATVGSWSCGSDPVQPLNDGFDGLAGLNYDESTSTFVYNWQTNASWTGCRKLVIKLKDASTHELHFKFQ